MAQIKINATYGLTGTLPAVSGANLTSLTSGNLTGALPAISGASLTTLNATNVSSGTLNAARYSGGKVLQVITDAGITGDNFTTSGSYSGLLSVNITPASTSNKVYIMCSVMYNNYGNGGTSFPNGRCQIIHSSTTLVRGYGNFSGNVSTDQTDQFDSSIVLQHLHSPSSTSQQTYTLQYLAGAGRFGILGSGARLGGTIFTLMEIAG
jgi:hypothetical protein